MASDFIGIDTKEVPPLDELLRKLTPQVRDGVVDEVSEYLINVLKINAPYQHITRRAAYGTPFFSDKQRKFVMAAIREGRITIPYHRSQKLSKGWQQVGSGVNSIIVNEVPYAGFVVGDEDQSRHEKLVGWIKVKDNLRQREDQIERRADAAAQRIIRKLGG